MAESPSFISLSHTESKPGGKSGNGWWYSAKYTTAGWFHRIASVFGSKSSTWGLTLSETGACVWKTRWAGFREEKKEGCAITGSATGTASICRKYTTLSRASNYTFPFINLVYSSGASSSTSSTQSDCSAPLMWWWWGGEWYVFASVTSLLPSPGA